MNKISIVPVRRDHLDSIIYLLQDISVYVPAKQELSSIWTKFITQPHVYGWVVLLDAEVIGYGSLVFEVKIRGGLSAHVEDIVISKNYRGKAYGRKLLEYLIHFATEHKCYKLSLQCSEENQSFYESVGFVRSHFTMQKLLS